ncbi:acyl-CoA dehydrogenase family protein [Roseomonas sp. SSH11]|uniref:Acyl-CoA dehydrogenase family protein n=1 Tax=Pararoseomonas baculiformis TaxID=2820812 RepID=A0ABS4ABE5_9PROT|nr:acyl-CoA dehydrogenase family protein [Pararoseomonas baculiformis]MBP0444329.1 acyl-CoA dehydrogenase family protein [Pararoseomonas baculiformis]
MNAAESLAFTLNRLHGLPALSDRLGTPLAEGDVAAILEEAGRFAEERIAPGRLEADRAGCVLENGRVRTPPGYPALLKEWREAGWQGVAAPAEHGGQGLPHSLWAAVFELASSADMSFALMPMLTAGAVELLSHHASAEQAARFLPPLISAAWNGTMCLTEPQAGSDLSAVRSRAVPDGQGGYRLSGQKIFITWGENDLAENTLHLVLARLPDAPPGSRGISLFACPKILPDGRRNGVRCGGVEHKPGIHACPTCTMLFEEAEAELVGEPNRGLAAMFAMMNVARLAVGVEGVGQCARATRLAEDYAATRIQGGRPIAEFPDVARMLGEMRAITAAARLIALDCAVSLDRARAGEKGAETRLALLTPITKAWCTDRGVDVASLGIQVHGGAGYVEETGAAQIWRDARIAPIYEGTNGIQAMDLVARKLPRDLPAFLDLIAEAAKADPALEGPARDLAEAAEHLSTASPEVAGAAAAPFLDAAGWVLGAAWLARAAAAEPAMAEQAGFFLRRLLPRARACLQEAMAG